MSAASPATPPSKPLALQHLQKARQNYKLYQELRQKEEHLDWAVTILFYTALHLVQAYLVEKATFKDEIPESHPERDSRIWLKLRSIHTQYNELESRSKTARYHASSPAVTQQDVQQCESQQFAPIVAELLRQGFALQP